MIFDFGKKDELVISKSCSRDARGRPSGSRPPTPTLIREAPRFWVFFPGAGGGGVLFIHGSFVKDCLNKCVSIFKKA